MDGGVGTGRYRAGQALGRGRRLNRKGLTDYARTIGIPGNLVLAEYVRTLERRLAAVENRLDGVDR